MPSRATAAYHGAPACTESGQRNFRIARETSTSSGERELDQDPNGLERSCRPSSVTSQGTSLNGGLISNSRRSRETGTATASEKG